MHSSLCRKRRRATPAARHHEARLKGNAGRHKLKKLNVEMFKCQEQVQKALLGESADSLLVLVLVLILVVLIGVNMVDTCYWTLPKDHGRLRVRPFDEAAGDLLQGLSGYMYRHWPTALPC